MEKATFSRRDTDIVKGIAIIALIIHHTCPNKTYIPISFGADFDPVSFLAASSKVCVSLLAIMSGYGLAASYHRVNSPSLRKDIQFVLSHYIQFFSSYWFIYLFALLWSLLTGSTVRSIFGEEINGIRNLLIDLLGLAKFFRVKSFIGDWYLSAVVVFYLVSPLIYRIIQRLKYWFLVLTYLPWVYYIVKWDFSVPTDWYLYYLFSFSIGMYLFQTGCLDRLKQRTPTMKTVLFAWIFLFAAGLIRGLVTMPADPLLAAAIILVCVVCFSRIGTVQTILKKTGENSANIWLLHHFVLRLAKKTVFLTYPIKALAVLCICLCISISLEQLKDFLHYKDLIHSLRQRLV